MSVENNSDFSADDLSRLKELPEFREMQMRANAAEAKLRRIYNTPVWKFTKPVRKIYARISQAIARKLDKDYVFVSNPSDGTPVIELVNKQVSYEAKNADLKNNSVAVIAHFSNSNIISASLTKYMQALLDNSYSVILVSACGSTDELKIESELKSKITVMRKPNLGYDFGSWAIALNEFPELLRVKKLLLTNDSLIGPFADISKIIKLLENSNFDVTGITDNFQLQYHIQSYLMLFNERALQNENVVKLLKSVVHLELKNDVILKYELGLTRTAQLSGLYVGAIFPWNIVVQPGKNPSLAGWQRLINLGFPFLKREAVRLGSHFEVSAMSHFVKSEFPNAKWAITEIDAIS